MMNATELRKRAAAYRRRAEEAVDEAVRDSLTLLAEIDEEEARYAESARAHRQDPQ